MTPALEHDEVLEIYRAAALANHRLLRPQQIAP